MQDLEWKDSRGDWGSADLDDGLVRMVVNVNPGSTAPDVLAAHILDALTLRKISRWMRDAADAIEGKGQPAPNPGGAEVVAYILSEYLGDVAPSGRLERIREILLARRQVGVERYGIPVVVGNGRDPIQDMEEEIADGFVYSTQAILEGRKISRVQADAMSTMLHQTMIHVARMKDDSL